MTRTMNQGRTEGRGSIEVSRPSWLSLDVRLPALGSAVMGFQSEGKWEMRSKKDCSPPPSMKPRLEIHRILLFKEKSVKLSQEIT